MTDKTHDAQSELPPLPSPVAWYAPFGQGFRVRIGDKPTEWQLCDGIFDADQMREYGQLCRTSDRDAVIEQCAARIESSVDLSGLSSDPALMGYTAEMVKCCAEIIRALMITNLPPEEELK